MYLDIQYAQTILTAGINRFISFLLYHVLNASNKLCVVLSITISWAKPKHDGGNPVLGYVVEKREKGTDKWIP